MIPSPLCNAWVPLAAKQTPSVFKVMIDLSFTISLAISFPLKRVTVFKLTPIEFVFRKSPWKKMSKRIFKDLIAVLFMPVHGVHL